MSCSPNGMPAPGRDEIIVPGYTCYSVPAAAVAAGLRVRLVDVDAEGRIDLADLARLPLERAAGVVVCNLFGWAEALAPIESITAPAGVAVLDDAAQSLGARDEEGRRVGDRGRTTVLSFGRGKPLQGLGGGAIVAAAGTPRDAGRRDGPTEVIEDGDVAAAPANGIGIGGRVKALVRSAVWDASLTPPVFSVLTRIPALGIGKTVFAPDFVRGPIDPGNAAIALAQLPAFETRARARRERAGSLAARIAAETRFVPVVDPRSEEGVYARLVLRAPSPAARTTALRSLGGIGAGVSALYPEALVDVPALSSHLAESPTADATPGSRALAACILTLPTNRDISAAEADAVVRALAGAGTKG